jgi:CBS domain-containing protein
MPFISPMGQEDNMDKYCVHEDYTIKEVVDKFEDNKERVMIVRNNNNKVIGVVSQGDIIRALSAGISLYAKVSQIISHSFLFLTHKDLEGGFEIFKSKTITLLPIVNSEFELIDVITLSDIYEYLREECGNG